MDLFNDTRAAMRRYKSVLVRAETGSGKTLLSAYMIGKSVAKGSRCGFVVPRKQLLEQTATTFRNEGFSFGYIASGNKPNPFALVQLCSAPTLSNRLERTEPFDILFIDECEFGGASMDKIIQWAKSRGTWIIGLTATPWRGDGKGLGCWFDTMVSGLDLAELIKLKRLSEYRLFAPQKPDMDGVKTGANGDWNIAQTEERIDRKLVGNAIEHYKKHAMGKLALGFSISVKKAVEMSDMFNDCGIPAGCVHGGMIAPEINDKIMSFARRELLILSSCELLSFGFDLSQRANMDVTAEAMIDTQPTKSLRKQRQKNGRVLRKKDFPALIFDHAGNWHDHGLPDDAQEWTLDDREKKKRGETETRLPQRQCLQCAYCERPKPVCSNCGHVFPVMSREIEEVDGDLEEIEVAAKKKQARMDQGKARTMGDLIQVGKDRGYSNPAAWARNVMEGRKRG